MNHNVIMKNEIIIQITFISIRKKDISQQVFVKMTEQEFDYFVDARRVRINEKHWSLLSFGLSGNWLLESYDQILIGTVKDLAII